MEDRITQPLMLDTQPGDALESTIGLRGTLGLDEELLQQVLRLTPAGEDERARPRAGLSLPQRWLLTHVDGWRSLAQLCGEKGSPSPERVMRAAFKLSGTGLLEEVGALRPGGPVAAAQAETAAVVAAALPPPLAERPIAPAAAPARHRLMLAAGLGLVAAAAAVGYSFWAGKPRSAPSAPPLPMTANGAAPAVAGAAPVPPTTPQVAPEPASATTAQAPSVAPAATALVATTPPVAAALAAPLPAATAVVAAPQNRSADAAARPARDPAPASQAAVVQPAALPAPAQPAPAVAAQAAPTVAAAASAAAVSVPAVAASAPGTAGAVTVAAPSVPLAAAPAMGVAQPAPATNAARASSAPTTLLPVAVAPLPQPVVPLVPVSTVMPDYPRAGLPAGYSEVLLNARLSVAADGTVTQVDFVGSNFTLREFERSARRAMLQWRFPQGSGERSYSRQIRFSEQ